jgi:ribosomal protein L37AE/L43A
MLSEAATRTCDVCGKPADDRMTIFEIRFCRSCGSKMTVAQVLEHKYGRDEARKMLHA